VVLGFVQGFLRVYRPYPQRLAPILRSRDKNDQSNLSDKEAFLKEWQQEGPIGTLLDLLIWINSTQRIEQFEEYQI